MAREAGIHPLHPNSKCGICHDVIGAGERMKPFKDGWAHSTCVERRYE